MTLCLTGFIGCSVTKVLIPPKKLDIKIILFNGLGVVNERFLPLLQLGPSYGKRRQESNKAHIYNYRI